MTTNYLQEMYAIVESARADLPYFVTEMYESKLAEIWTFIPNKRDNTATW